MLFKVTKMEIPALYCINLQKEGCAQFFILHRSIPVSSVMRYARNKGETLHRRHNPAMKNTHSHTPKIRWMNRDPDINRCPRSCGRQQSVPFQSRAARAYSPYRIPSHKGSGYGRGIREAHSGDWESRRSWQYAGLPWQRWDPAQEQPRSARVYRDAAGARRFHCPRYMTAILSEMWRTTRRSWAIKR